MDFGILPVVVEMMTQFNRDVDVQRACLGLYLPIVSVPDYRLVRDSWVLVHRLHIQVSTSLYAYTYLGFV